MKYELIMLGTDTELFLRDVVTGLPISAEGLVGGTKAEPLPVLGGHGYAVQEDNVMVEFNVPPAETANAFDGHIKNMLDYLKASFAPRGMQLLASPSMAFHPKQLQTKQAQHFGCEPDYCAWSLTENDVDKNNPLLETTRTAGGHVHVSFTQNGGDPSLEDIILLVKSLDMHLGIPSIMCDQDKVRRTVYGKAGAFRIKKYGEFNGLEYRVLSNFWIKSQEYRKWVFTSVERAMDFLNHCEDPEEFMESIKERILSGINDSRLSRVEWFAGNYGIHVPEFHSQYVI